MFRLQHERKRVDADATRQQRVQQDHQALLKAKYCPRVAQHHAHKKKTQKKHVTLTFDLWP